MTRSGRQAQYYIRFFPATLTYLIDRLTPVELQAYMRLAHDYVVADGELDASDESLMVATRLKRKLWVAMRDKLIQLRLCRIESGRWIIDDLDSSLALQRAARARAQKGGEARWKSNAEPQVP